MAKKEIDILLIEIEKLMKKVDDITEKHIIPMREELASLQTKSKIWGAVTGTIAGGIIAGIVKVIIH
jgi:hypothetical protein